MQGYIDRGQLAGLITVLLRRGQVAHYHMPDGTCYQGLDLPQDVLEKIYSGNFERLYGTAPASLTETK
jgi:predicted methyltransferase